MSDGRINQVSEKLGQLDAYRRESDRARALLAEEVKELRSRIEDMLIAMGSVQTTMKSIESTMMTNVLPSVKDYKEMKIKGIGVILGVGLAAGGFGAGFVKLLTALGSKVTLAPPGLP
jgi:hypothetical protein